MTVDSLNRHAASVAFLAAEVAPFAKVGGLGDVAGSLPPALRRSGIPIVVLMPRYGSIDLVEHEATLLDEITVRVAGGTERCSLYRAALAEGTTVLLLDQPALFGGPDVYVDALDRERFAFFCRAVPAMLEAAGFQATVIHANDWHTAPSMLEADGGARVFTIHNLAHQGIIDVDYAEQLGLPTGPLLDVERSGHYPGKMNLMARAILAADVISTVSPRYAEEITTPEFGAGLDSLLRSRKSDLTGILNGIDVDAFDPSRDPAIPAPFSVDHLAGKTFDKAALQRELGLEISPGMPLIGIVSRLDEQKGFDLILAGIERILGLGVQMAVLGTGTPAFHAALAGYENRYPGQLGVRLAFDPRLAQLIYAGSDMFLMPSRFEPCGLGQMIAMRYGSVPIVRLTGGLADTVSEEPGNRNGFTFIEYHVEALVASVSRAVDAYHEPATWFEIVSRGMRRDVSWDRAAGEYIALYQRALDASTARRNVAAG